MYQSGLSYKVIGDCKNPSLLFLHGFLGCKEDWEPIAERLASRFCCCLVDLPGHGGSAFEEDFESAYLNFSPVCLIGYSLGGRLALRLKRSHPHLFSKLVVIGGHVGLQSAEEREKRWEADVKWAEELATSPLDQFLKKWYSKDIFSSLLEKPMLLSHIISRRSQGQNCLTLSQALRSFSLAKQPFFLPPLSTSLFLCGEEDRAFISLYDSLSPLLRYQQVENAGHMAHIENPQKCAQLIGEFCDANSN